MARILVTGGAGYVGSHTARAAMAAGHEVVVVDNLSTGHAEAFAGRLVRCDLRDRVGLSSLLAEGFDAVVHFAALTSVRDSVADPVAYWDVNVAGTISLLGAMHDAGCRALVFSSSCAVYGVPARVPLDEDLPFAPISPYGATKAAVESVLIDAEAAGRLRAVRLRYFNAAGASSDAWIGESHDPETHLIPLTLAAASTGQPLNVFGTDHPTPDGTCVRDYVHVEDLARAHLAALDRLLAGEPGGAWNLGTGTGNSVAEVLDAVERITGLPVPHTRSPARAGDPPILVAHTARAQADLGWSAQHDLDAVVRHAWAWFQAPRF